jgi:threonine/homoserine/homoserine lactone efflux protein
VADRAIKGLNMHRATTQPEAAEALNEKKKYDRQFVTAATCLAIVFLLSLPPYAAPQNIIWHELKSWGLVAVPVILSSFAFVHVLPAMVRGHRRQRLTAIGLAVFAGYFAFKHWEMVIENYVING